MTEPQDPSAEQRAEQLVAEATERASRTIRRLLGRAREEAEDILAEARSINRSSTGK